MAVLVDRDFKGLRNSILGPVVPTKLHPNIDRKLAAKFAPRLKDYAESVIGNEFARSSLKQRTGRMVEKTLKGIKITGKSSIESMRITITVPQEVAIHEFGGRIRAKSVDYLAIPVLHGLRPDGTPRMRSPKSYSLYKVFVHESKDGRLFLAYRLKNTRELKIIYVLEEEIILRKRLRIRQAFEKGADKLIAGLGQDFIAELKTTNWFKAMQDGAKGANLSDIRARNSANLRAAFLAQFIGSLATTRRRR